MLTVIIVDSVCSQGEGRSIFNCHLYLLVTIENFLLIDEYIFQVCVHAQRKTVELYTKHLALKSNFRNSPSYQWGS